MVNLFFSLSCDSVKTSYGKMKQCSSFALHFGNRSQGWRGYSDDMRSRGCAMKISPIFHPSGKWVTSLKLNFGGIYGPYISQFAIFVWNFAPNDLNLQTILKVGKYIMGPTWWLCKIILQVLKRRGQNKTKLKYCPNMIHFIIGKIMSNSKLSFVASSASVIT